MDNLFFGFAEVEQWVVLMVCNPIDNVVVCKRHNSSLSTVVGVQCEQEGAEHTALGGSSVQHQWRRCDCQSELTGDCL